MGSLGNSHRRSAMMPELDVQLAWVREWEHVEEVMAVVAMFFPVQGMDG